MDTYNRYPISILRGEGSYLFDHNGMCYLDFTSGVAVNSLGHQHPNVTRAILQQVQEIIHCSNLYHHPMQERLAELLTGNSCMDQVFYCNSGAEANEAAFKLTRRYEHIVRRSGRYEILSLAGGFHGRSLATTAATGISSHREGYQPLMDGFRIVEPNVEAINKAITKHTCAIILEPIQVQERIYPFTALFLSRIRELCNEYELLLIYDEIACGLGRTGRIFAYQHSGVEPDILTIAKSLGNGIPIGVMLAKQEIAHAFNHGSHASTLGGNPLATAAAIATIETIVDEGLSERAELLGDLFMSQLQSLCKEFPLAIQVHGIGLMLGLELQHSVQEVIQRCMKKGLLIAAAGSNTLRFLPPLTVSEQELNKAVGIIREVFTQIEEEGANHGSASNRNT